MLWTAYNLAEILSGNLAFAVHYKIASDTDYRLK